MATFPLRRSTINHPPTAKGHPIFGLAKRFQENPLRMMGQLHAEYGDSVRVHFFGPFYGHMFIAPDHFKHVLQDNHRNYTKLPAPSFVLLQPIVGNGLLTSEGDFWLRQRRLAQPAFHRKQIAEFGRTMTTATATMLERWATQPATEPLDIAREMHELTLEIVGQTLFSIDLTGEAAQIGEAVTVMSEEVAQLSSKPFGMYTFKFPFLPRTRRINKAIKTIEDVVYKIIAERRADTATEHHDLLGMFMSIRDEDTGEMMDDRQLRDEVITMILAGHETTAVTLSWIFYLLSQHGDIYKTLKQEIDTVLDGRIPTMADVRDLAYLNRVIQEAMRLYPPAYVMARIGREADQIGEYDVPANAILTMSIYHLHHNPDLWENPEQFDPDRFLPERSKGRPRWVYLPFGAGPRQCIGNQFALTEAALITAMVLQRFELKLVDGYEVEIEPLITLRPKNGLPMHPHPVA